MIKAYLLTTGDDGHSHVQSGSLTEGVFTDGASIRFQETAPHSFFDWHTAPTHQYVISLSGILEFTTGTGEKFILRPGEILIAMDTTGSGHQWKITSNDPWKRAYVLFDPTKPINFTPDQL